MMRVCDIFCGAGGLSFGFAKDRAFELVFALDNDKSATLSYQANHPNTKLICKDINELTNAELKEFGVIDILLGGPPCQSYSTLGKRQMDERANLFKEYLRVLESFQPKAFIFENVVGLLSMQKGELFSYICKNFEKLGYRIYHQVLNAADFGVPQIRQRVIIVGIRQGFSKNFMFPQATHKEFITLEQALNDLPPIKSGENGNHLGYKYEPCNEFLHFVRKSEILSEHESPKNNENLIKIMQLLKDGQSKDDLPLCVRPKSGYTNTYAKMWWQRPAPTITRNFATPSSSRCIHPRDSRALSIREGARLQSFPDDYVFCGNTSDKKLQIGNAVPPLVSMALAKAVRDYFKGMI
ncbi:MAG: DNA cytosine methyltransferase [Helicobacter sp.]|nr:DNA cytosine methyltransferase [Helicobacter sp.]